VSFPLVPVTVVVVCVTPVLTTQSVAAEAVVAPISPPMTIL